MTAKVALITGAGSGIGRAVVIRLASAGYRVVLTGRRQDRLDEVARQCGPQSLAAAADVTDAAAVGALFERVRKECGRLDVLFNNAGTAAPPMPLEDLRQLPMIAQPFQLRRQACRKVDRIQPVQNRELPLAKGSPVSQHVLHARPLQERRYR